MKRKASRRKKVERKKLEEIFPDEWITDKRNGLAKIENAKSNIVNMDFKYAAGMALFYRCMGEFALEYVPKDIMRDVTRDVENVCNRVGFSVFRNRDVDKCLAPHEECRGRYYNPLNEVKIACKCACHGKKGDEMQLKV